MDGRHRITSILFAHSPFNPIKPLAFNSAAICFSGDPLFDDLTAKVGVALAPFGPSNSLTQDPIRNPFLPGNASLPAPF